ncbi:uncharacterized protein LOC126901306 [Daktulosphaira vitifoliae]|uniref:uncharacterized protein LOC126901306 n=1 Tax=Daktulosphaira vitifoliae TaxID=58002 RepID=UPI0021AA2B81|nr:uncharacterized protein LOC126901306 [Daktulosphaira vitifoliae]
MCTLIYTIKDSDIKKLFTDEVKNINEYMDENIFMKQMSKCVIEVETNIRDIYWDSMIDEKLTIKELIIVLKILNVKSEVEDVIELMIECNVKNSDDINWIEFRNIFGLAMKRKINSLLQINKSLYIMLYGLILN